MTTRDSGSCLPRDRMEFIVYDMTTEEGVKGARPVKPDLVSGLDLESDERVTWSPKNSLIKQVLFPVAIQVSWVPVVDHYLFSTTPSRPFAAVLEKSQSRIIEKKLG